MIEYNYMYIINFRNISIKHGLELVDKLVLPILNYGCEVWGFHSANNIECSHTILQKHSWNKTLNEVWFFQGEQTCIC